MSLLYTQVASQRRKYDRDARAYLAATGASQRDEIDAWVKGIKALSLWDEMICWPLRSTQNHGTGTTARSLGGLGNYPGTLVNGPTWGADGLLVTHGSSQAVTVSVPFAAPVSTMLVAQKDLVAASSGTSAVFAGSIANIPRHVITAARLVSWRSAWTTAGQSYTYSQGAYNAFFGYGTVGTQRGRLNGATANSWASTSTVSAPTGSFTRVLGLDTMTGVSGTINGAMTAFFIGPDIDTVAVYNLYKDTLGKGLGLP